MGTVAPENAHTFKFMLCLSIVNVICALARVWLYRPEHVFVRGTQTDTQLISVFAQAMSLCVSVLGKWIRVQRLHLAALRRQRCLGGKETSVFGLNRVRSGVGVGWCNSLICL